VLRVFKGLILENAVSHSGAIAISSLIVVVMVIQVLAQLQASSRFVFSLARDNALPFSSTISRTNSKKQPIVATWVVIGLCTPGSLMLLSSSGILFGIVGVTAGTMMLFAYVSSTTAGKIENVCFTDVG
jgi:amino acid transporter